MTSMTAHDKRMAFYDTLSLLEAEGQIGACCVALQLYCTND